jgi:transcriptional regulator with PAS, ATPase and Fis domain
MQAAHLRSVEKLTNFFSPVGLHVSHYSANQRRNKRRRLSHIAQQTAPKIHHSDGQNILVHTHTHSNNSNNTNTSVIIDTNATDINNSTNNTQSNDTHYMPTMPRVDESRAAVVHNKIGGIKIVAHVVRSQQTSSSNNNTTATRDSQNNTSTQTTHHQQQANQKRLLKKINNADDSKAPDDDNWTREALSLKLANNRAIYRRLNLPGISLDLIFDKLVMYGFETSADIAKMQPWQLRVLKDEIQLDE